MTKLLVSVRSVAEARLAFDAGVDVIDLKDPSQGILGALAENAVSEIVASVNGRRILSATVGDLPLSAPVLSAAVARLHDAGVDYVKIGFPELPPTPAVRDAMAATAARGVHLVAVLFADLRPDLKHLSVLVEAGFWGVMIDTAHKNGSSLCEYWSAARISEFLVEARSLGLVAGLAGSLRFEDIPALLELAPDYLGVRGLVCVGRKRNEIIDDDALQRIRSMVPGSPSDGGSRNPA